MADANYADSEERLQGVGSETVRVFNQPHLTEEERQAILAAIPTRGRLMIAPNPVLPVPGTSSRVVTRQPQSSARNPFARGNGDDNDNDSDEDEAAFCTMLKARAMGVRSSDCRLGSLSAASATVGLHSLLFLLRNL